MWDADLVIRCIVAKAAKIREELAALISVAFYLVFTLFYIYKHQFIIATGPFSPIDNAVAY